MKMKNALLAIAASTLAASFGAASATDKSECVNLVKKAGTFYKEQGKDKVIAEINNPKGQFANGEIYLFMSDFVENFDESKDRTITLAHGANPKLIGKDMTDLKDADGVYFVRKMAAVANTKEGKGWTDYKWPNPVTKTIEPKTTYTERVGGVVISCGIYK